MYILCQDVKIYNKGALKLHGVGGTFLILLQKSWGTFKNKKILSCYYLFAMKENVLRGGHKWLLIILSHLL